MQKKIILGGDADPNEYIPRPKRSTAAPGDGIMGRHLWRNREQMRPPFSARHSHVLFQHREEMNYAASSSEMALPLSLILQMDLRAVDSQPPGCEEK